MNSLRRKNLRERFLAEQQTQLAEDAKLADPAAAYRELIERLESEPADGWWGRPIVKPAA